MSPLSMATLLPGFKLSQDEVHVWYAALRQPADVLKQLSSLLSGDERARAERYQFEHLQQSFVVARGVLRLLLASYLDLPPEQLIFTYLKAGKPQLARKYGRKFFFNLSHSHELVLYAFGTMQNIGVDVEYIRPFDDLERIAERNFSAGEVLELETLSLESKLEGFFNCWTRKEAYIKAIGDGLSFPLQEFDVSLKPGEPARLLSVYGNIQDAARWSMLELHPAAGYVAALVVEGHVRDVICREWNRLDHFLNI